MEAPTVMKTEQAWHG